MRDFRHISLITLLLTLSSLKGCKMQSRIPEDESLQKVQEINMINTDNNLPAWAAAVLRVFPNWEIIKCDDKPSVKIGECDGYRLVLRQNRKEHISSTQQIEDFNKLKFVIKHDHIDLVLLKNDNIFPDNIIEKIPWLDLEQEQFTKPVYMGTGQGFKWFANTTLYFQEYLRKKLELEGGDDRIQLLTDGLFIKDDPQTTQSVMILISEFGDKAVESIEQTVQTHNEKDSWSAIFALHTIQSQKSADLLKRYYHSENSQISNAAAYSLIFKPFKIQAKKEYFEMLAQQKYVREIGKACVEFNWKDALPIFEDICSKPKSWSNFYSAFIVKRRLEEHPVPEELIKAQETIRMSAFSTEEKASKAIAEAKQKIIECPDKEASTVIAFNLVEFTTKGRYDIINRVRNIGFDLLRMLPEAENTKLYKILEGSLDSKQDRDLLQKFREILNTD